MNRYWIRPACVLACLAFLVPVTQTDAQSASPTLESKVEALLDLIEGTQPSAASTDQPAVSSLTTIKAKVEVEEASTRSACERMATIIWSVGDNDGDYMTGISSKLLKCKNGVCKTTIFAYAYVEDANLANEIEIRPYILPDCINALQFESPPPKTQILVVPDQKVPQGGTQKVTFKSKI